jgi:hypothetical protein
LPTLGKKYQNSICRKLEKWQISAILAVWHGGCCPTRQDDRTALWEAKMINRNPAQTSFWSTRLGQAAIASIAAMVMMIALSTHVQPGSAYAALLAHPAAESGVVVEIA